MRKKQLAKRIKLLRKEKGMTQEQLAEKIGVSSGWVSKIERGMYSPNLKLLDKIAKALGIKVGVLFPF